MINSQLYAKLASLFKQAVKLAYLENATYDQLVAHLEQKLELSGLETLGNFIFPQ